MDVRFWLLALLPAWLLLQVVELDHDHASPMVIHVDPSH